MENIQREDEIVLFPVEFLNGLEKPPAVLQFLDEKNQYVQDSIVDDIEYDNQTGRYRVRKASPYKFQITTDRKGKLSFIVTVISNQMKNELQFGNALSYPVIEDKFEKMVFATMQEYNSHNFVTKLSAHSNELVKRSIHSCGLGIALALFLGFDDETIKAIGLGDLFHEYGYLIDPSNHTVSGAKDLASTLFKEQKRHVDIILDIIQYHHSIKPHPIHHVNCGKIAIHWCSQPGKTFADRMQAIHSHRSMYSEEIYNGFRRLYDITIAKRSN